MTYFERIVVHFWTNRMWVKKRIFWPLFGNLKMYNWKTSFEPLMFHKHGLLVMAESHIPTDFCLRLSLIMILAPPNYPFLVMAPSTLQVYKYTGYTVYNLMYILHLIGCCCFSSRIPERLCNQAVLRLWELVVWMFSLGQSWWLWCWQRVTWHWSMDEFTQNTPDDRHTRSKYPQAVPLCHRYPRYFDYMMLYCKPVFVFCAESTPRAFHVWPEKTGTPWVWPDRFLAICQGWNIARKHVALVPCLIGVWVVTCCLCFTQLWWYRPWDLSLGGARGVCWQPQHVGVLLC